MPSLYFGVVPLVMFVANLRNRSHSRQVRFLIALSILALLASMGNYSLVWLVREAFHAVGLSRAAASLPPDHVGSLYWCFVELIPGYSSFRYPAKWSTWFVAAATLIGAQRFEQQYQRDSEKRAPILLNPLRRSKLTFGIAAISSLGLVGLVASYLLGISSGEWLITKLLQAPDKWLGLPKAGAVTQTLWIAFGTPLCVLVIAAVVTNKWQSKTASAAIVALTLVELSFTASLWSNYVDSRTLASTLGLDQTAKLERGNLDEFLWANSAAANLTTDLNRLPRGVVSSDLIAQTDYQNIFAVGKLATAQHFASLHASESITPIPLIRIRSWLSANDRMLAHQPLVDELLRELGVTHRLIRDSSRFKWFPVENPKPFCEFLPGPATVDSPLPNNTVDWQWKDTDNLFLTVHAATSGRAIIRQFSDGGWQAVGMPEEQQPVMGELFITIDLAPGDYQIQLQRKPFY